MTKEKLNQTTEWLTTIHAACHFIDAEAYELERLAAAFDLTGNEEMAKELGRVAQSLKEQAKRIPAAIGEHLSSEIKKSNQALADTLEAIIK